MSSSGLIYAAIALMWAAVLIPMWLRNHDSASESRSVERFGQAMRVLRRDQSRDEHGEPQMPQTRSEEPGAEPERRRPPQPRPAERRRPEARPQAPRRQQPTLAQRRARTLGALAGLVGVLTLLAVITPLPWWVPLPVFVLLVAFVVHLRVQARQRMQIAGRRTARQVDRTQPPVVAPAEVPDEAVSEYRSSGFVPGPSRAVVVETKGSRTEPAEPVLAEQTAGSVNDSDDSDDGEWRPNPLPLPTYVTAPKAVRPIKVIDLTTPGAWSSGRLIEDDVADEDLLAAEVADAELDALLEQEAVGHEAETPDTDAGRRAVGD